MKKKLLILAPYPFDCAPSQRFRFEQYISFLEKDLEVEFESFIDLETWNQLYFPGRFAFKARKMLLSFWRRIVLLFKIGQYDYLFIHREMAQVGPPILEWFVAKILRKKFIYDFDDAIWIPNYSETNATFQRLKAYWKVRYIMKWAHHVTAGNQFLADFAKQYNSNVSIVPTTIDTTYHLVKEKSVNQVPVIGWTGSHTTMHYLSFLQPVLIKLAEKHQFKFRVISNQPPEFELCNLEFVKWSNDTEIEDLSAIDIGVMPLVEDKWASGKCAFKALQYMALGMPAVVSPVGVNESVITNGKNGYLAMTEAEWFETLNELLEHPEIRARIGQEAINTIENRYSVNAFSKRYLEIITS